MVTSRSRLPLPAVVAHADWSIDPAKRWIAVAGRDGARAYRALPPRPVGELSGFLEALVSSAATEGSVFLGFDFPLGLPSGYAERAGVGEFRTLLPRLGRGRWRDFFSVAAKPSEISLTRPFFPRRPGRRGEVSRRQLLDGLGVADAGGIMRLCDHPAGTRPAASPLFWTLGAKQVGKSAIAGWRDLLIPALGGKHDLAIWPFDGPLGRLLAGHRVVVAETYPAEVYGHLGLPFGETGGRRRGSKRVQADRAANAAALLDRARALDLALAPALSEAIDTGFGPAPDAEDPFDATVGLLGMLNVLRGGRAPGAPDDPVVRKVEGWILGQTALG